MSVPNCSTTNSITVQCDPNGAWSVTPDCARVDRHQPVTWEWKGSGWIVMVLHPASGIGMAPVATAGSPAHLDVTPAGTTADRPITYYVVPFPAPLPVTGNLSYITATLIVIGEDLTHQTVNPA